MRAAGPCSAYCRPSNKMPKIAHFEVWIELINLEEGVVSDLIQDSPNAQIWIEAAIEKYTNLGAYDRIASAVVWSDAVGDNGELILPVDPEEIVLMINRAHLPLLDGHDPGRPLGQILESSYFTSQAGRCFVAAVLGYYGQANLIRFEDLGINVEEISPYPQQLPPLGSNLRIDVEADPREVDPVTLAHITGDLDVPVEIVERSHNSAEAVQQFVAIGVPYALLVWNPFITIIAQEAGKDVYKKTRSALAKILERVGVLENPVCEIQAYQSGCTVSFIIRGKGVKHHRQANALLSDAARKAHRLIENLKRADLTPVKLVYEFDRDEELWAPSFAKLADGRLLSDNLVLIAAEDLPKGLSLGLALKNEFKG